MFFLAATRWARRCTKRCVAWPWRRRQSFFCAVSCWQNVKICEGLLEMPSFQSLAGRWDGRCAERRIAWPWRRRQSIFPMSYHVGKTLKSLKVCLECPVFNALGTAVCCPQSFARRWVGRRAEKLIAWPWQTCQCKFFCARIVLAKR